MVNEMMMVEYTRDRRSVTSVKLALFGSIRIQYKD